MVIFLLGTSFDFFKTFNEKAVKVSKKIDNAADLQAMKKTQIHVCLFSYFAEMLTGRLNIFHAGHALVQLHIYSAISQSARVIHPCCVILRGIICVQYN